MNFTDTSYIIMGGTAGLGLSASLALKKHGAKVLAIGRDREGCQNAREQLGDSCITLCGDAIDSKTIDDAIAMASESFGGITGLFHVAGGSGRRFGDGPLHEMSREGWDKTLELNLTSMMLSNRAVVNYFLDNRKSGVILNMGSVLGYSPSPEYFVTHAYAAAKSAIIGFSKSLASHYAQNDIRVNVIAPGLFATPMAKRAMEDDKIQAFLRTKQPLDGGRSGKPDDINNAVLMFLSPSSNFITGQVLAVDGGWAISDGQIKEQK